jgi:hypothetical protein
MGGKMLPHILSPGVGYGNGPRNDSPAGYDSGIQSAQRGPDLRPQTSGRIDFQKMDLQGPNDAVILEGYRNDIMNGFEGEKPLYNPVSTRFATAEEWDLIARLNR